MLPHNICVRSFGNGLPWIANHERAAPARVLSSPSPEELLLVEELLRRPAVLTLSVRRAQRCSVSGSLVILQFSQ